MLPGDAGGDRDVQYMLIGSDVDEMFSQSNTTSNNNDTTFICLSFEAVFYPYVCFID